MYLFELDQIYLIFIWTENLKLYLYLFELNKIYLYLIPSTVFEPSPGLCAGWSRFTSMIIYWVQMQGLYIPLRPWSLPYSSVNVKFSSCLRSYRCSLALVTTLSDPFLTKYCSSSKDWNIQCQECDMKKPITRCLACVVNNTNYYSYLRRWSTFGIIHVSYFLVTKGQKHSKHLHVNMYGKKH